MPLRKGDYIRNTHVRILKFRVETEDGVPNPRRKFTAQRRKEVGLVRRNRACLRCSLLKIRCNDNDVCKNCSDLVIQVQKKILSFSGCIRTRLSEVSVFGEPYLANPSPEEQATGKCNGISFAILAIKFSSSQKWELTPIIEEWHTSLQSAMKSGDVRITSAPKGLEKISAGSEAERQTIKRMALEEAVIHNTEDSTFQHQKDLVTLSRIAAHGVLQSLDNRLKPQSLKDNSYADMQVLFITVLGIMNITNHMLPEMEDSKVVDKEFQGSEDDGYRLATKSSHLYQVLAHYLVYLGSQLGISYTMQMQRFIIQKRGFDKARF